MLSCCCWQLRLTQAEDQKVTTSSPERMIISAIINTQDVSIPLSSGLDGNWFREYPKEWSFIHAYYRKHRRVPSAQAFKLKFPSFRLMVKLNEVDYATAEMITYHTKQSLMSMVEDMVDGVEKHQDPSILLANMYRGLVDLQGAVAGTNNELDIVSQWRQPYSEAIERANKRKSGGLGGVSTGFITLDTVMNGFNPGEMHILAARLGIGKTWFLVRAAFAALMQGKTILYFAMEQSRNQLAMRLMPFISRQLGGDVIKSSAIASGTADLLAYQFAMKRAKTEIPGKLIIDDTPRGKLNPLLISAKIERLQPDIVFVDYLGLLNQSPGDWTAVSALSAELKAIAMGYGIPMVVAAQLNRAAGVGVKFAGPEALAGSDAIGQDADSVITVQRRSPHLLEAFVGKYRHGRDGDKFHIEFQPDEGIFEEITVERADVIKQCDDLESPIPPAKPPKLIKSDNEIKPKLVLVKAPAKPKLKIKASS